MKTLTIADVIETLSKYPLETPLLLLTEHSVADHISCQEAWINSQLDNVCLIGWNNDEFTSLNTPIIDEIVCVPNFST